MIKSVGKSEHGSCDHKTSRNITCCAEMREIFVWVLVVCRWGELGLGRRRKNRGGEGRHQGIILTFSNGFTNGYFRRCIRRLFYRKNRHITVRISHFKSVGDSIGIFNGEPVMSLYGPVVFNPLVIPSEKTSSPKLPRQRPAFFFLILNFLYVIQSVTTYENYLSVVTD